MYLKLNTTVQVSLENKCQIYHSHFQSSRRNGSNQSCKCNTRPPTHPSSHWSPPILNHRHTYLSVHPPIHHPPTHQYLPTYEPIPSIHHPSTHQPTHPSKYLLSHLYIHLLFYLSTPRSTIFTCPSAYPPLYKHIQCNYWLCDRPIQGTVGNEMKISQHLLPVKLGRKRRGKLYAKWHLIEKPQENGGLKECGRWARTSTVGSVWLLGVISEGDWAEVVIREWWVGLERRFFRMEGISGWYKTRKHEAWVSTTELGSLRPQTLSLVPRFLQHL